MSTLTELSHIPKITQMDKTLTRQQRTRLEKYYENLDAYEGYHFENRKVSYDEEGNPIDDASFEVTVNFTRRFVDKLVRFVLGDKGFSIDMKDPKHQDIILPYLNKEWDRNKHQLISTSMLRWGSVLGDVYVIVEPSKRMLADKLEDKVQASRLKESLTVEELMEPNFILRVVPATNGFPYYREDKKSPFSSMIFFEYKEVRPRLTKKEKKEYPDRSKSERAFLRYADYLENRSKKDGIGEEEGDQHYYLYRRVYYTDRIEEYADDRLLETYKLNYGLVSVVHIPNKIRSTETPYGDDDITDLIPLNYELNYKASDVSEIINYYQSPLTLFFGVGLDTIEKGSDRILTGLPDTAKVENLEMKGDLASSQNYLSFLKQSMLEVFGITPTALTGQNNISNTSGIALHMQYEPLVERKQEKVTYLEGIAKVNTYLIYLGLYYNVIPEAPSGNPRDLLVDMPELFMTQVTFPNSLPKDELLILQKNNVKLSSGLGTREDALREMGETDPVAKLKEIEKDRMEILKIKLIESLLANIAKDGIDSGAFATLYTAMSSGETKVDGTKTTVETDFATGLLNDPMVKMLMDINASRLNTAREEKDESKTAEVVSRTGTKEMKQVRARTQNM